MIDWEKLKIFYNVAEGGSFAQAAARLHIDPSAISRHISSLEDRMGVALFARHARGITLTEHGNLLLGTTRTIFADLAMARAQIMDATHPTQGTLKIAATIGFGIGWLTPHLHRFSTQNPEVRLILHVSDIPVDLGIHESDVSITTFPSESADLICHALSHFPLPIYASRQYLFKFGIPMQLSDLDRHRLLTFSDTAMIPSNNVNWLLTCGTETPRKPYLSINNLFGIAGAVNAGSGIACLPPYIAKGYKNIVQILPDAPVPQVQFYFSYSRHLKDSQKIQNLWHVLQKEVQKERLSS